MTTDWIDSRDYERDGTSQIGRSLAALSPDYVRVDERTTEDFVEFARQYGKTLAYFNAEGKLDGNFDAFIGNMSAKEVAAFLENPEAFDPDRHNALFRPHFTLFAVFLKLLEHTRANLNTFTRRHLDYHFRRFLQMQPRPAVPDQVNLVFFLADREANALVPAGTLLSAGVDALGKDRLYKTSTNLVVNRAQIGKVSSVFVERKLIGVADSWHSHRNNGPDGRFEMLRIAYGEPLPGDPLPNFRSPLLGLDQALDSDENLDALLKTLQSLTKFCSANLTWSPMTGDTSVLRVSLADLRLFVSKAPPRMLRGRTITQTTLSVPGFPAITTIDTYWKALLEVEAYFAMPIESLELVLDKILLEGTNWNDSYKDHGAFVSALLEHAHHDKWRAARRQTLSQEFNTTKSSATTPGDNLEEKTLHAYAVVLEKSLFDNVDKPKGKEFINEFEDGLRTYLTESDAKQVHDAAEEAAKLAAKEAKTPEEVDKEAELCGKVLDLLAHAMTLRIGKAPPRQSIWLNVHPAEDAKTVRAKRSKVDTEGNEPFSTFGAALSSAEPTPILGFAVTSPILELSGGKRKVTLTLGLRAAGFEFEELKNVFNARRNNAELLPLAIEISTAKGWLRVTPNKTLSKFDNKYQDLVGGHSDWNDYANAPGLQLVFELAEGDPAIVPLPNPPDGMDARYPAVRILMQPVWNDNANVKRYVTFYRELTSLFVGAVHIKVTASELSPTAIENDESILDPKKPFEPFGSLPVVGSRLSFGHPEIVTKKIDRLKCEFEWAGKPADFTSHYANYGITPTFTAKVRWCDTTGPKDIPPTSDLFAGTGFDLANTSLAVDDHASTTKNSFTGRVKTWRRYLQWELKAPDFQHGVYASKAAEMAMKLAIALAKSPASVSDFSAYQVKPPYTPKLAYLKLGYDASVEILLYPKTAGDRVDRTYHVHPFGVAELRAANSSEELPLLPRYDKDSELCIGLSGVALPETVTILFRLDEGSADRDIKAPVVQWSQLSGNQWIPLGHRVLQDETMGLQRSGVIALSLDRALPSTMLPAHLTWVRASIAQDHASICDTRKLHTQAVRATFEDRGNAPEHYGAPLPAGKVAMLKMPIAGIVGMAQRDPSFGGRPAEDERTFSTRVSERLRHKQRALSSWDYERIILGAFPQIFKAKCVPMPEDEPGRVDVLVLPDVRMLPTNELGPKAPIALLGEIEAYLEVRAPSYARVNVRNATFRAVRLRLGVRFTEVGNDAYWMGRLNEELNRYLSPWAYDEGVDIVVGGRIHASNIVDFVDRREYVDYMAGVSLFYTDDEGERFTFLRRSNDTDEDKSYAVDSGGPMSVLVGYLQHRIDLITTEHYDAQLYRGVGYMEMEMDFVVG